MFDNIIKSLPFESQTTTDAEEAPMKAVRHPEAIEASYIILNVLASVHGAGVEQGSNVNPSIAAQAQQLITETEAFMQDTSSRELLDV